MMFCARSDSGVPGCKRQIAIGGGDGVVILAGLVVGVGRHHDRAARFLRVRMVDVDLFILLGGGLVALLIEHGVGTAVDHVWSGNLARRLALAEDGSATGDERRGKEQGRACGKAAREALASRRKIRASSRDPQDTRPHAARYARRFCVPNSNPVSALVQARALCVPAEPETCTLPLVFVRRREPDNPLIMVFFCSWLPSARVATRSCRRRATAGREAQSQRAAKCADFDRRWARP